MTKDSLKLQHKFRITIKTKSECIKGSTRKRKYLRFHQQFHHNISFNVRSQVHSLKQCLRFHSYRKFKLWFHYSETITDITTKINRMAILQNFSKWMSPYAMEIHRVVLKIIKQNKAWNDKWKNYIWLKRWKKLFL